MSAFEHGWSDAEYGRSMNACPFPSTSGESIAWRNGYRAFQRIFDRLNAGR